MKMNWNSEKNSKLKRERNIGFEDIVNLIKRDQLIDIIKHPNQEKYSGQLIMVVNVNNYCYLIPFVIDEEKDEIFLKTIIPSRKYTKTYLGGG
jgi:uncharacterized DUF497 family protein